MIITGTYLRVIQDAVHSYLQIKADSIVCSGHREGSGMYRMVFKMGRGTSWYFIIGGAAAR